MNDKYRETFELVRASDRLRTEVMNMTEQERGGGSRRFPKAALIAAALALALAGTAIAAEVLGLTVNFKEDPGWNEDGSPVPGFEIIAERAPIPVESLSQELLELAASTGDGAHQFALSSLKEVEDLWRLELRDNPMLRWPQTMYVLTGGEELCGACMLYLSCNGGELMWASLTADYRIGGTFAHPVTVNLKASIVTDRATDTVYENALNSGRYYNTSPDRISQSSESYVTPSGLEAVLVTTELASKPAAELDEAERPVNLRETCAFFVRDDVLYELSIEEFEFMDSEDSTYLEDAAASALLKQILDAYE